MNRFTDIHTHIIYGVDDGARDNEMMEAMLDRAFKQGVGRIYATSHYEIGLHTFHRDRYERHLLKARDYCKAQGYDMEILPGAEMLYTPAMDHYIRHEQLMTLGDSNCVLLEFVPDVERSEAENAIDLMNEYGYKPVLAHIERYDFMTYAEAVRLKKDYRVSFQVNCKTLLQKNGLFLDMRIAKLFKNGLIDHVASDTHNNESRRCRMKAAYNILKEKYGTEYAQALTGRTDNENGL